MAIQEIICGVLKLGATCLSMPVDKLLIEYLLVPSVILIIILYFAVNLFLLGTGVKIKGLLAIVFYIVIIYQGWYGFIAQFIWGFIPLWLLGAIGIFILGKIVKKEWVVGGPGKVAETVEDWKKAGKKITSKDDKELKSKIREYKGKKSEIENIKDHINKLEKGSPKKERREERLYDIEIKQGKLETEIYGIAEDLNISNDDLKNKYGFPPD